MWYEDLDEEIKMEDVDEELSDDEISMRESAFVKGYIEDYREKPEAILIEDDDW